MANTTLAIRTSKGLTAVAGKFTTEGVTVHIRLSPCAWMHPNHGLQYSLSLEEGAPNIGCEFVHEASLPWAQIDDESVRESVVRFFATGGMNKLVAAKKKFAEWRASAAALDAQLDREEAQLDAQRKASGNTHKLVAWVHSRGDDRQIIRYGSAEQLSKNSVIALLARHGCTVRSDFAVKEL